MPPSKGSLLILLVFSLLPRGQGQAQSIQTNLVFTSLPEIFPSPAAQGLHIFAGGLSIYGEGFAAPGEEVWLRGKFYPRSSAIYGASWQTLKAAPKFAQNFARFRLEAEQRVLSAYGPENAALVLAMVFGNKNFSSPRLLENARSSGMSHFFALSGLHMALASGMILLLFSWLGRRQALWAALPFSALYLLMGGLGLPLRRAFLFHLLWAGDALLRWNLGFPAVYFLSLVIVMLLAK